MRATFLKIGTGFAIGIGVLLIVGGLANARPPAATPAPVSSPAPAEQASFPVDNGLAASNRDRLRICVQSLTPSVSDTDTQAAIASIVLRYRTHPQYQHEGLGDKPITVDRGCPGVASIDRPNFPLQQHLYPSGELLVAEASPYRLFIYAVTPERLSAAGLDAPPGSRLLQREIQFGDVDPSTAGIVTSELYVTPAEVADPAQMDEPIRKGFNLRPLVQTLPNREPVRLHSQPGSSEILHELAPGTILIRLTPEFDYPGTSERWIGVQEVDGRKGFVQVNEVAPIS